jgi:hypothetical protein
MKELSRRSTKELYEWLLPMKVQRGCTFDPLLFDGRNRSCLMSRRKVLAGRPYDVDRMTRL